MTIIKDKRTTENTDIQRINNIIETEVSFLFATSVSNGARDQAITRAAAEVYRYVNDVQQKRRKRAKAARLKQCGLS